MHQGQYGSTTKFQKAMKMYTVEVGEHFETPGLYKLFHN